MKRFLQRARRFVDRQFERLLDQPFLLAVAIVVAYGAIVQSIAFILGWRPW